MIDLGKRPYNSGYGWYQDETVLRGQKVIVYVSGRGTEGIDALTARANRVAAWIEAHFDALLDYSADQLLTDKNADWSSEAHPAVTRDEFKQKPSLGALRIHADKTVEMTFTDGGLFWGHWIMIWMDEHFQLTKAYIDG